MIFGFQRITSIIITHFDPWEGKGDLSDATLLKSVSVVTFDDDVIDVPLVRRDETRDVPAVGGINRSGYLKIILFYLLFFIFVGNEL